MADIASIFRRIRARLGMTRQDFGKLLGVSHTNISRYESGRTLPGYLVAGRLLELAEGTEKNPIVERLAHLLERPGLTDQAATEELRRIDRWRPAGSKEWMEAHGWRVLPEEVMEAPRLAPPQLADFVELATVIMHRGKEVDRALVEVLALWLQCDTTDDEIRRYFADAAKFLEVSLATWKAKQEELAAALRKAGAEEEQP